jgi:hypothetical protein
VIQRKIVDIYLGLIHVITEILFKTIYNKRTDSSVHEEERQNQRGGSRCSRKTEIAKGKG